MALRIARGLFRLWLVLSVLWIGGVAVVTWRTFPPEIPERRLPYLCELNKDCSWLDRAKRYWSMILEDIEEFPPWERSEIETIRFATLSASLLALIPPAFVLAFGSALIWAQRISLTTGHPFRPRH